MQNVQIWKSIEALCDEAESLIKDSTPVIAVIQSIAPPAHAYQGTSRTATSNVLPSKPAPPKANVVDKPTPKKNETDTPLSPATMTEIAAAIDRATQNAQKPQIMDQAPQAMNDQLRKDLMIEVSLAVRSVLANELPKMVHHAISDSLYELINSSANPSKQNPGALEAKPRPNGKNKKITSEKRATPKKIPSKKVTAKNAKGKKQPKKTH